jgi:hypothetical protein
VNEVRPFAWKRRYSILNLEMIPTTCIPKFRWKFRGRNPTSIVYRLAFCRPTVSKMLWKLSGCHFPVDSSNLEMLPPVSIRNFHQLAPSPIHRVPLHHANHHLDFCSIFVSRFVIAADDIISCSLNGVYLTS